MTSLDTALDITPASTFTVCTEGTFSATTETGWPKRVPPNVVLDGTFCGNNTVHSTMLVPAGQAGVSLLGNQAMIRGYDIIGLGGGGSTTTVGIVAAPSHSAVDIRDVTVSGFDYGIMAQNPVSLTLSDGGGNVSCTSNGTGLDVSESASVTIQRTQDLQTSVSFSHNTSHGIVVQNASLTVKGGVYAGAGATALSRTIAADANGVDGLAISSGVKVVLDGFEAVNNRAWGIGLDDSGTFSLANSVVTGNTNGLHIVNSADPTAAPNVAMINLGTAASGTGAGNNHIFGNSQAGVCLDAKPSGTMPAKGNIWSADGSKDCTGTPTAKLTHISDCTMPVDVARGSENMTVDGCAFE